MQVIKFLCISIAFSCVVASVKRQTVNLRPIIGILDQPTDEPLNNYGKTYLVASYIKWVESAGGRVVPVPYNSDPSNKLSSIM